MRQNRVHLMPPMSNFYARICVKATPSSNKKRRFIALTPPGTPGFPSEKLRNWQSPAIFFTIASSDRVQLVKRSRSCVGNSPRLCSELHASLLF